MKMFLTVSEELSEFLLAQAIAVITGVLYDFLRCIKSKKISKTAAEIFDLLTSFVILTVFCALWCEWLSGKLRWHTVSGLVLTLILYFLTIHKPIFTAYCIIWKKISSFFGIIFKFLLTVWAFFGKIKMYISMLLKKMYFIDYEGKNYERKRNEI